MTPAIEFGRIPRRAISTPASQAFLGLRGSQPRAAASVSDEGPRVIFQGTASEDAGGAAASAPRPSRPPLPHERQVEHFRRSFSKALQLRDATQKRLEAKFEEMISSVRSACLDFRSTCIHLDDSLASLARSAYPREMAEALRAFESRIFPAFTGLSVELRTAMEEYNHVVLTIPSPTLSTSTMSRQSGDADWESVDGETGGTGAEAQAMSAGGQPATQGAPEEEMASFQSVDGTTRLELIARYLEEMESLWIDFEIALQDMCERLKAESNTADGVYKQVVTVGEAGAAVGGLMSVVHLIRLGKLANPVGWTGLAFSLLSFAGLERTRRELQTNANQLQDLREKTRRLSGNARTVVEGYRAMVLSGCGDMLDQYEERRDDLRRAMEELKLQANGL